MTNHAPTSLSPERWREVFEAADRALELAPDERALFFERCCRDDPALGAELRALLASADAGSALDAPAAALAGPVVAELSIGPEATPLSLIGPYRIVRELGRGGMGVVYLAERADEQYRKQVALKVLSGWGAGDAHRVRRFQEERQILAALEHPDIARLLDGGITTGGLPWFAMEYVDGLPIDRYCDAQSLSIERRLELFCRVCTAVQHAHRNLVVHRDLKPANILVSGDGGVKLLDFGIAKLLGDDPRPALTQTGERVMTPLYASPEQVQGGPVSTASDVYSLGVLLYQLLVGRPPYRLPATSQPHDVARAILEQDPERPSAVILRPATGPTSAVVTAEQVAGARGSTAAKLGRRLRGDLDAIVVKAMEKDPRQRYGSVEQLEADVRRHLAGLPVAARPANRVYQARKFIRRHRVGVVATLGMTLVVLGFTVVTMVQSVRVAAERDRAEAVQRRLLNVFRATVPPSQVQSGTAREFLDSSAAQVERDLSAHPDVRASLLFGLGRAYHDLGIPTRARDLLEASLALRRRRPDDAALASTLVALGDVLVEQRELTAAERAYEEALTLRRKRFGARHSDVARSLNALATVRLAQGRAREADSLSRNALAIDRVQPGDNRVDVAQSLRSVGHALVARGEFAEAARHYEEALSMLRQVRAGDHLDVASGMLDLAAALRWKGDNAPADSLLRGSLAMHRRLAAMMVTASLDSAWVGAVAAPNPSLGSGESSESRIAFVRARQSPGRSGLLAHFEVYIMNPDGSDQRRLTHSDGRVGGPAISPDGKRIAFNSQRGLQSDIFVMDAGGGEPVPVTNMDSIKLGALSPTWSPDGNRLAFNSFGGRDIYVINVDGTALRRLTHHPARDQRPAWSPKGDRIAFVSERDGSPEIFVMNADGANVVQLTSNIASKADPESPANVAWYMQPSWSPDGRKIAFAGDRDGNREIYVINADGTGLVRLTANTVEDGTPSWSPDGRRIAFGRLVLGRAQIYVMNADDGTAPTPITQQLPDVFYGGPSWGPAPVRSEGVRRAPR